MLNVAITGLIMMAIATIVIKVVGKYPGPVVGLPVVAAWFGGAAMVVFGVFGAIWW